MIFHLSLVKAEDDWIVAGCPALPGCISRGRDEKGALEKVQGGHHRLDVGRGPEGGVALPGDEFLSLVLDRPTS